MRTAGETSGRTRPTVNEEACPVRALEVPIRGSYRTTIVVRTPPGKGPFPVVVHLHGGLDLRPVAWLIELVPDRTAYLAGYERGDAGWTQTPEAGGT